MEITIKGNDEKRLKLVEDLARELGLTTESKKDDYKKISQEERSQKLYQLMEDMAKNNLFDSIEDPVAWQKEMRKDKPLYGRE